MTECLLIDLACPGGGWAEALPEADAIVRTAAEAAWQAMASGADDRTDDRTDHRAVELSIVLADDEMLTALNRRHRGKDGPTNVLSFPLGSDTAGQDGPVLLGDVVLAFETVAREAVDQKKTLADHLQHLVIHGILHLSGYDHETEDDAERMERFEARILAELGVADPYLYSHAAE